MLFLGRRPCLITGEMERFCKGGSSIVKNEGSGERGRFFF